MLSLVALELLSSFLSLLHAHSPRTYDQEDWDAVDALAFSFVFNCSSDGDGIVLDAVGEGPMLLNEDTEVGSLTAREEISLKSYVSN